MGPLRDSLSLFALYLCLNKYLLLNIGFLSQFEEHLRHSAEDTVTAPALPGLTVQ